ncbi:lectin-like [Mantella aurantiaca]
MVPTIQKSMPPVQQKPIQDKRDRKQIKPMNYITMFLHTAGLNMSLLPSVILAVTLLSLSGSHGWIFGKHGSHEDSKSVEIRLPFLHFGKSSSSEENHGRPQELPVPDELNPKYFCQGPCKDGWITYLGYCHTYVSRKLTWKEAEGHCQSLFSRAHLTSVLNEKHNLFLMALAESHGSLDDKFWTGANSEKGSKSWSDGSPLSFLKLPGNLINKIFGRKLCLSISHGGGSFWNQLSCSEKLPFVCIYKPSQPWDKK